MTDDTEKKQQLLKDEIFDKGYDIEKFSCYMDELKPGGGSDIDLWSMSELQNAVNQYQALKNSSQKIDPKQEQQLKIQQLIQSYRPELLQDENNFVKYIECKKIIPNQLSQNKNIQVEIKNFEKKAGSMFSSSYVNYRIQTQPFGLEVQRRYTDFIWLRDLLIKLYPGLNIPPIPRKSQTRNFQDIYLIKRMKFLEKFINKLLLSEELLNDKFLEYFLMIQDEKQFRQVVRDSEKIPKISRIDLLVSRNERVILNLNGDLNNFIKNQNELLNNLEIYYKRIRKQSKQLMLDFDNVSNTMFGIGESFAQLFNITNQFNSNVKDSNLKNFDEMFITLNNMMIQWGNIIQQQVKEVQDSFCNFFKFYNHEVMAEKEYLKQREQAQSEYEKFKYRLDLKKDKLFQVGDVGRFEIPQQILQQLKKEDLMENKKYTMLLMLPKETSAQLDLRDVYGYYNYQAKEELNRIQNINIMDYANHFLEFVKQQSSQVTQFHILWADILTTLQAFGNQSDNKQLQLMQGVSVQKQVQQQSQGLFEES